MKPLWQHGIGKPPVIPDFPMVRVGRCLLLLCVTENAPGVVRSANRPCYKEEKSGKITMCLRQNQRHKDDGHCCAAEAVGR